MRLTDLDPRWLLIDGVKVGFIFISPTNPKFYQSCMFQKRNFREQARLFQAVLNQEDLSGVQSCNKDCAWTHTTEDFATISVMPSLDGSPGGLWHGFITNGEIVGGV